MKYIEQWTEQRRQVAQWYRDALQASELILPAEREDVRHVYHLFVVRHQRREQLLQHLANNNVFGGIHYPHPLSEAQPFEDCRKCPSDLPVSSALAGGILSLPMYPEMTREHVDRVAEVIGKFEKANSAVR